MENKFEHLDFCNKNSLSDGVLKEMLRIGYRNEVLKEIDTAINRRCKQIEALEILRERIKSE